jgi:AcrR family transcriptional regulator
MARPRIRPEDVATTDRVLAAAEAEFARRGYEGARLADIASEAGIRRPSLLYHYASKQSLYAAVVTRVFADLGQALRGAAATPGPFFERFEAVIRELLAFFDARASVAALILRELLDAQGPGHALLLEAGVPILQRIERFVREDGRGVARAELPIRQALLQIFAAVLVRTASGPLRDPIWGKTDRTRVLARTLFLEG